IDATNPVARLRAFGLPVGVSAGGAFEQNFERTELRDIFHSEDRRARSDRARPSPRVRRALESGARPERFLPGGLGDGFAGCFSPHRSGPFEISKLSVTRGLRRERAETHRGSEPD